MERNDFSPEDIAQIEAHGLTLPQVEVQMRNFRTGFAPLPVERPAIVGDGVLRLDRSMVSGYASLYDAMAGKIKIVKFVPASGAATRMFKELFEFIAGAPSKDVERTIDNLSGFAFAEMLADVAKGESSPEQIVGAIVGRSGLGYGSMPKALIMFHKYPEGSRTAAQEHLVEGAMYASSNGIVNIHFTVSPEHLDAFRELLDRVVGEYERRYGVKYEIAFSQQLPSTDTIAVALDDTPFRETDGSLLFRPAGHGALMANLNTIDADIIFIKNIDNVAPDQLKADTVLYKKALGGLALELQAGIFERLRALPSADDATLTEIARFAEEKLSYLMPELFSQRPADQRRAYLAAVLDRPLRVCGVVKNEGEPGGGPFWVTNQDGALSLQIAEPSQIAPAQAYMLQGGTHFNPVDIVCMPKNGKAQKYDLMEFTDPGTGFISEKSKDGRLLKAQELPGLWNGAMARWNTVFVEVPGSTFSPVKVVNDLLRPEHQ